VANEKQKQPKEIVNTYTQGKNREVPARCITRSAFLVTSSASLSIEGTCVKIANCLFCSQITLDNVASPNNKQLDELEISIA